MLFFRTLENFCQLCQTIVTFKPPAELTTLPEYCKQRNQALETSVKCPYQAHNNIVIVRSKDKIIVTTNCFPTH